MDMMPPQAPPAIIRDIRQEAVDAERSLTTVQDWLLRQQAALPMEPAAPDAKSREDIRRQIRAFWSAPVEAPRGTLPRSALYAVHLTSAMRAEAALSFQDGLLTDAAARLATRVANVESQPLPPGVRVFELMLGDVPYAGALVASDPDGTALRFIGDAGWEAFPSMEQLRKTTESEVRTNLAQNAPLPGITLDDAQRAAASSDIVAFRDITVDPFTALVARMTAVVGERAEAAWAGIDDSNANAHALLSDRLAWATNLQAVLNIDAIRATHVLRRIEVDTERRLAALPVAVRGEWRAEAADYLAALRLAARAEADDGATLESVREFAAQRLRKPLVSAGIVEDPETIVVNAYPMPALEDAAYDTLETGRAAEGAVPTEAMSLVDLALRNTGLFDDRAFFATAADGRTLGSSLNHFAIRRIVRDADVARTYREHLIDSLATSTKGRTIRDAAAGWQRSRMRFEAADARLAYYLPAEPSSFVFDQRERGYQWIQAILQSPVAAGRSKVEGHDIVVRQVTYMGAPVADVLVVGVRSPASVSAVVLYTPDAPDGQTFREFTSREEAARQFLYAPAFESYLLDRLPDEFATQTSNGARHFRIAPGRATAAWTFGGKGGGFTRTDEAFGEAELAGDFLHASYDTRLSLISRNLAGVARSNLEADVDNLVPSIDSEAIARSLAAFIGRPFSASWRAYDHIKAGDRAAAVVAFTDAYTSALDLYTVARLQPWLMRSAPARLGRAARGVEAELARLRRGPAHGTFEAKYAASHVPRPSAAAPRDGIHRIGGKPYIEQGGIMYAVRFDTQTAGWRLTRANAPDAAFSGPAVTRGPSGQWQIDRQIGLRGGWMPGRAGATSTVGIPAPADVVRLAPDDWPDEVWCYVSQARELDAQTLFLPQQRSSFGRLNGISASSVDPGVLGGRAPAPGAWVRVHLRSLRARRDATGQSRIVVYRVPQTRGFGYILQPGPSPGDSLGQGALLLGPGDFSR